MMISSHSHDGTVHNTVHLDEDDEDARPVIVLDGQDGDLNVSGSRTVVQIAGDIRGGITFTDEPDDDTGDGA